MADEVKARSAELIKAFQSKDLPATMAIYTDDCRVMYDGREAVCGKAAVEAYFKEIMDHEEIKNTHYTNHEVKIDGDYAFETGNFSMDSVRGTERGQFLLVWKKVNGKYFLSIDFFPVTA